jgi:hypothetical protein
VLQKCGAYLPSFQISVASFQSSPTFSQTTTYFPVTSFGVGALVFKLKVPISRAAEGPSGLTSSVVNFGSLTCPEHSPKRLYVVLRAFLTPGRLSLSIEFGGRRGVQLFKILCNLRDRPRWRPITN